MTINDYSKLESYRELEEEMTRLKKEREDAIETQKQIENNAYIDDNTKNADRQRLADLIKEKDANIQALTDIKNNYNIFINNIRLMQSVLTGSESQKAKDERLKPIREGAIVARKQIPEKLYAEVFDQCVPIIGDKKTLEYLVNEDALGFESQYYDLYEKTDQILKTPLDELGLYDYDKIILEFDGVLDKLDKLGSDFSLSKAKRDSIARLKQNDLDSKLYGRIQKFREDANTLKENKQRINDKLNVQISAAEKALAALNQTINDYKQQIKNPEKYKLSKEKIEEIEEKLAESKQQYNELNKRLTDLKKCQQTILNGGKVDNDFLKSLIDEELEEIEPLEEDEEKKKKTPGEPEKSKSKPKTTKKTTSTRRKKGAKKTNKTTVANSLESLIKDGVLPQKKFLSNAELLKICSELNINISDTKTPLTPEQIDRLKEDHEIQTTLLRERIYDRNMKKISEYNDLIKKYETILNDKMGVKIDESNPDKEKQIDASKGNFSNEYAAKVKKLLDKLKLEKEKLTEKNKVLIEGDYEGLMTGFDRLGELSLDSRATRKNNDLREEYKKLDELRAKKFHSKLLTRFHDFRIKLVLSKIEKLKTKKATLATKQAQIVNENSDKYIERMSRRLGRYITRQDRVEKNVDKINDISAKMVENEEEMKKIRQDLAADPNFFEKVALNAQLRKLGVENWMLDVQKGTEDAIHR